MGSRLSLSWAFSHVHGTRATKHIQTASQFRGACHWVTRRLLWDGPVRCWKMSQAVLATWRKEVQGKCKCSKWISNHRRPSLSWWSLLVTYTHLKFYTWLTENGAKAANRSGQFLVESRKESVRLTPFSCPGRGHGQFPGQESKVRKHAGDSNTSFCCLLWVRSSTNT